MGSRTLLYLGACALAAGLGACRAGDATVLSSRMDAMAAGWEAQGVPREKRSVTILLSDASASYDPFALAPVREEGPVERLRRSALGGAAEDGTQTALARAFSGSTRLIAWTFRGFAAASEDAMSRDVEKAVLKARAAGASVDIVAQGASARPVLEALGRLAAANASVGKVLLPGARPDRKGLPRPGNAAELAGVWSTREVGSRVQLQVFGGPRSGEILDAEALWPGIGEGGDAVDKCARLLRDLADSPETLDALISRQEALRRADDEKKAAAEADRARAAEAEARKRPAARGAAPAPAADGWVRAELRDFSKTKEGLDIGWTFSAPAGLVDELKQERATVTLPNAGGLTDAQCTQSMRLSAVPSSKLGEGERGKALFELWERESGLSGGYSMGEVSRQKLRGFPANIFKTSGGAGAAQTYLVVETGSHLIYLVLTSSFAPKSRDACLSSQMPLYQKVAESIRPAGP